MPSPFSVVVGRIKNTGRAILGGASAASRTLLISAPRIVRRPRILVSAAMLALVATAILSITAYRAFAIGGGQVFDGTKAPGAHEWWKVNHDTVEADFCGKCHAKIVNEVAATRAAGSHPIATCEGCHGAKTAGHGHVAVPRKCSDCHPGEAKDLREDAHSSFITDIGESADRPSWSCKACHTHVEVDMQVTPIAPIRLVLGGLGADTIPQPAVTPTATAATPTPAGTPTSGGGGDAQRGKAVFNANCNACHPGAKQGVGPGITGVADQVITSTVRSGKGAMPTFGQDKISDQQLQDLLAYLHTVS